jgi:integrase
LSSLGFAKLFAVGRHCDGGGLYLQVSKEGTRSWIFRYQFEGRVRDMGLGSAMVIGLSDARDCAVECRRILARGLDPIEERLRKRREKAIEAASALSFKACAQDLIEAKRPSWRSAKHAAQWLSTLQAYAFPHFGALPVSAVDTSLVLKALTPIWNVKNDTAVRVRERIEAVLDAARARGARDGENPARWKGHLETLLPRPSKVKKVRHQPALPYSEIAPFMELIRKQQSTAALAMELLILTATRTSEAINARWEEFDLDTGVWTIPANRIKAGKEHRIPLSEPAKRLLLKLHACPTSEFVFPGQRQGKPLSNMALLKLLERMGFDHITTHGFRSTFRDWAAELTSFPREVAEMALAHAIENKVEAAYRRGGLFEKRAKLMAAWASYCGKVSRANIVPLHKSA